MKIGVPTEIKPDESRVALVPAGVHALVDAGHEVFVQEGAGDGSGFTDEQFVEAGATMVAGARKLHASAELIVKVKEPQVSEAAMYTPNQTVFGYYHLAAADDVAQACIEAEITAIAYETVRDRQGRLCLLTPMSEIAGKMSVQEGAKYLERPNGGRGVLLGGVPGVAPANVVVLGGGVVGTCAAKIAAGFGANVDILDVDLDRLRYLDDVMPANVHTVFSNAHAVADYCSRADLVVGAVLIPGAKAPHLVTREMLKDMQPGAVAVDVAVDQGGCFETSRPTTHQDPTYVVDGVVHYCVSNMPGAVSRTSTIALCNATFPYVLAIANQGVSGALQSDPGLREGVNLQRGRVTNAVVAASLNLPYTPLAA
ncbi:MAG: alanine dehydrogenase [Planctomycetota bacterium]